MTQQQIQEILERQRQYFNSGATLPVPFRIAQLKRLHATIRRYETQIADALYADLGKSYYESFMCEIGMVLSEISYMLRHVRRFAKGTAVRTPLAQFYARSRTLPVPRGNVLIMSPWNYPFLLTLDPLVDAIAAGNTAILKPSAYAPASAAVITKILRECFSDEYVAVINGGRAENTALLAQRFDMIFFTGSRTVGQEVLRHAAVHLTPTVLELGGKSPCIVDATADIALTARRIVFGKFLNCGQTCVAPDYILCDSCIHHHLVKEIKRQIHLQYGENPLKNPVYGKIINKKHFDRLCALIDSEKTVCGGQADRAALRIAPTVSDNVTPEDAVMQEEIFGPILPIIPFSDFDALIDALKCTDRPLALYLFSTSKRHIDRVNRELVYGGGCINDVVIHLATAEMGFGGVGESGMGAYHGKTGFDAFSHRKSIVKKGLHPDLPMRYAPYGNKFYEKLLRMFLK